MATGDLLTETDLRQIGQLAQIDTWDGDLISKDSRDKLVRLGFARLSPNGFSSLTMAGMMYWHHQQEKAK